jgi:hypothetical protein
MRSLSGHHPAGHGPRSPAWVRVIPDTVLAIGTAAGPVIEAWRGVSVWVQILTVVFGGFIAYLRYRIEIAKLANRPRSRGVQRRLRE